MFHRLTQIMLYCDFKLVVYSNFIYTGHRMPNLLFELFEHKCVLEVCVQIHPIMIQVFYPVFFFNPYFKIPENVLRFLSE